VWSRRQKLQRRTAANHHVHCSIRSPFINRRLSLSHQLHPPSFKRVPQHLGLMSSTSLPFRQQLLHWNYINQTQNHQITTFAVEKSMNRDEGCYYFTFMTSNSERNHLKKKFVRPNKGCNLINIHSLLDCRYTDHSVGGLPTGVLSVAVAEREHRSSVREAFDPRLHHTKSQTLVRSQWLQRYA